MEPSKFISHRDIEAMYRLAAEIRMPRLGLRRGLSRTMIAIGIRLAEQRAAVPQAVETAQIASEQR